jgi:hypothetical protein
MVTDSGLTDLPRRGVLAGSEVVVPGKGMPIPNTDQAGSLRLHFNFAKLKKLDEDHPFSSPVLCSAREYFALNTLPSWRWSSV